MLLSSIKGLDQHLIFVPGESSSQNFIELHKIDLERSKLLKIKLLNNRENELGQTKIIDMNCQEYLPEEVVDQFLPFNCIMKLDEMTSKITANI